MKTQTVNRLAPALMLAVIGLTLGLGWMQYAQTLAASFPLAA